jgi:Helix-turn-helix domain
MAGSLDSHKEDLMPSPPTSEDYWLTRTEVSERLRVPEKTVAQWASLHKGPRYAKFGRHCRYLLSDVIAWENSQFNGGSAA